MLILIEALKNGDTKHKQGLYRCGCGVELIAFIGNVNRGHTRSCGCLRRAVTSARTKTHGVSRRRPAVYSAWRNMRQRCNNSNRPDYANYGGRGITICSRWDDFENFLADMGEPLKGMTLDRIDNNAGYSKENCRWATSAQQNLNKRNCVRYEFMGKKQTLAEWSRETGIGRVTLLKRIQRGVPVELALSVKGFLKMPKKNPATTSPRLA